MKSKILIILLIISLAVNAGIIASMAFHANAIRRFVRGEPFEMKHNPIVRSIERKMGLSKIQTDEVNKIMSQAMEEVKPLRQQIMEKRKELIPVLTSDKIDKGREKKLLDEIFVLQRQVEEKTIDNMAMIRQKMTPEQKQKMDKFVEKRMDMFSPPPPLHEMRGCDTCSPPPPKKK